MAKPFVGVLHRLAPRHRARTVEDAVTSVVAVHSTDPASVHLALAARTCGSGASVAEIDRALYDVRSVVRVMGMRRTLWAVPSDLVPIVAAAAGEAPPAPRDPGPWAALVPSLDSTTMGWKDRSWYLGDLGPRLFDRNGNAGPTIWWRGGIVGGWAQRPGGEVVTELLVDVGRDGRRAVAAETDRLQQWLDASGASIKPRFPTPLHTELVR